VADPSNTVPILVELLDQDGNPLISGTLDPGASIDIEPGPNGEAIITNLGATPVSFTVDGVPIALGPGQTFTDQCLTAGGNVGDTGCPVAVKSTVTLHTVSLGGGTSTQNRLAGAEVRLFDRNSPEFLDVTDGTKNPDGSLYGVIFETDEGQVGTCVTDVTGTCFGGVPQIGEYLAIVKYLDASTGKTVYVGRPLGPDDFTDTTADGLGDLAAEEFQIMKVLKQGVLQGYRGGSKVVVTGSVLEMIVPQSAIWEGTQTVYPFIFTSDSTWSTDVCAQVPHGYSIVGVYDENGQLFASRDCVQLVVAGTLKIVAFEVVEVGSPEPVLSSDLKVAATSGKVRHLKLQASDIRKRSFDDELAKARERVKRHQRSR
jgi:hypothetical protein